MSETCFVTGAGGFIGSHLVDHLVRQNFRVKALVRYTSSASIGMLASLDRDVRQAVQIEFGDVCDGEQMAALVAGCDRVFHLAALIGIPYSYHAPRSYVSVNISGTQNILEAVRRHEVARVVLTSTSEVYGTAVATPMPEEHRLHPQSPYAASKVAADQLGLSYHRSFGTPVVIVRPFNTFGPRQSMRAVIPTIIAQALARTDGKIELGATSPRRDLLFCEDTAAGMRVLGTAAGIEGETFNLSTGQSISIGELAAKILALVGKADWQIESREERIRPAASEVEVLEGDSTKIRTRLGWQPAFDLDAGLSRVIDYMRANADAVRDVGRYHV